jgi:hypothetical protein
MVGEALLRGPVPPWQHREGATGADSLWPGPLDPDLEARKDGLHATGLERGNNPRFLMEAEFQTVKMGRDFRLRSFNDYRERFGLKRLRTFEQLTANPELRQRLCSLYGHIDKLEVVVGLFAEDPAPGGLFGPLMLAMVAYDAFTQIYTNPLLSMNVFTAETFSEGRPGADPLHRHLCRSGAAQCAGGIRPAGVAGSRQA